MTITGAIERLQKLREIYGDVEVLMDCPRCGSIAAPTSIIAEPIKVKLTQQERPMVLDKEK